MVMGMFTNVITRYGSFIYIDLIQSCKIPLQLQLIFIYYWLGCLRRKKMTGGGKMWDQTYGCTKQYMCSIAYYLMSYLSK